MILTWLSRGVIASSRRSTIKTTVWSGALTFEDVAARTKLPLDQIELLAMHALSLGLIRGSIDQVDGKLNMHWVKPRVLDLRQVATLKKRLDQWTNDVKQMSTLVEQQAGDILS